MAAHDKIKSGDKFRLNSKNGQVYLFDVFNVNEYRPPESRYCSEAYNATEGGVCDAEYFCDRGFFDLCEKIDEEEYKSLRHKKK